MRQHADAERKVLKREAKSAGFENTYDPVGDWNSWLDKDQDRHRKSRHLDNETDKKRKLRKEKDALYQKNKRANETHDERWNRQSEDAHYQSWKRRNDRQKKIDEYHFKTFGNS